MKNYKIPLLAALCIVLTCSVSCPDLLDIGIVPIANTEQEKTNWCWAASCEAVIEMNGTPVTQCEEANWLWSRTDCCAATTCNWPATASEMSSVLTNWGLANTVIGAISWNDLKAEIDAGRAMCFGFLWCPVGLAGGHAMVILGFSEIDNTPVVRNVLYMNPWPGEGYTVATYDWMVSGCPGSGHDWAMTITNIH